MVVPPRGSREAQKRDHRRRRSTTILTHAPPPHDGRYRAKASLLAEGEPLGNWSWGGVRTTTRTTSFPTRTAESSAATRLLTAWLNHYDTGDNQTLSMWIPTGGGRGWVRHHTIDWNDSLGFLWAPELDQISRRLGLRLLLRRGNPRPRLLHPRAKNEPWERAHFGKRRARRSATSTMRDFVPEEWKSGYPNPAFSNMTERDAAWMARILARFTDAQHRCPAERGARPIHPSSTPSCCASCAGGGTGFSRRLSPAPLVVHRPGRGDQRRRALALHAGSCRGGRARRSSGSMGGGVEQPRTGSAHLGGARRATRLRPGPGRRAGLRGARRLHRSPTVRDLRGCISIPGGSSVWSVRRSSRLRRTSRASGDEAVAPQWPATSAQPSALTGATSALLARATTARAAR